MSYLRELRYTLVFALAFATGTAIGAGKLPTWVALAAGFGCGLLSRWLDPPRRTK